MIALPARRFRTRPVCATRRLGAAADGPASGPLGAALRPPAAPAAPVVAGVVSAAPVAEAAPAAPMVAGVVSSAPVAPPASLTLVPAEPLRWSTRPACATRRLDAVRPPAIKWAEQDLLAA